MIDPIQKIDEFVQQRRQRESDERAERYGGQRESFYVSEAGKCPRKIAYSFFGLPQKALDGRVIRLLENGDFLQQRYSGYFKELGVWLAEEVAVNVNDHPEVPFALSGRCDILINLHKLEDPTFTGDPQLSDMAVIEMKSVNTYGFSRVTKEMQPEPEHYLQIQIYLWLLGIQRGFIIYEDKNDQNAVAIPVTYDERVIYGDNGIINTFANLGTMIDSGETPTRCPEANADKFPCKWRTGQCDYYDFCWDEKHNGVFANDVVEINGITVAAKDIPQGFTKDEVERLAALLAALQGAGAPVAPPAQATFKNPGPEPGQTEEEFIDRMFSSLKEPGRPNAPVEPEEPAAPAAPAMSADGNGVVNFIVLEDIDVNLGCYAECPNCHTKIKLLGKMGNGEQFPLACNGCGANLMVKATTELVQEAQLEGGMKSAVCPNCGKTNTYKRRSGSNYKICTCKYIIPLA